jgi:hypothetical protein
MKGEFRMKLDLYPTNEPQKRIKEYLENSVSEVLGAKINNGSVILKDGQTLINMKTLDGFMKYATQEAQKMVEKGSHCACVQDDVVFGWAVHYFEEDSIEENLFNLDGSKYSKVVDIPKKKAEKKAEKKTNIETHKVVKFESKGQISFF